MQESLRSGRSVAGPSALEALQEDVDAFVRSGLLSERNDDLTALWSKRTTQARQRLVGQDGRLDRVALENFRRSQVLVEDLPRADLQGHRLRNNFLINAALGERRATIRCLRDCLAILEQRHYATYLRRYPCHPAGNPAIFSHAGYRYTYRWARHIYFLGLLKEVLADRLRPDSVVLDIGSSYGIFSSLVKAEYPGSAHVLVDLPLQLIAARYFLSQRFPEARIAGMQELQAEPPITRELISQYDFVLIPPALFDRLQSHCADLVTNFGSFCEMRRERFAAYLHSPPLETCQYLFVVNRIQAKPIVHDDITILDYPIWRPEKKLHFDICPMYSVSYSFAARRSFFTRFHTPPPFFEYIGLT